MAKIIIWDKKNILIAELEGKVESEKNIKIAKFKKYSLIESQTIKKHIKRIEAVLKYGKNKEKNEEKNWENFANFAQKQKGQSNIIRKSDKIRRKQKDKVKNKQRENIKLRTENKQLKKEIDEYENYNKRISEIFEQKQ